MLTTEQEQRRQQILKSLQDKATNIEKKIFEASENIDELEAQIAEAVGLDPNGDNATIEIELQQAETNLQERTAALKKVTETLTKFEGKDREQEKQEQSRQNAIEAKKSENFNKLPESRDKSTTTSNTCQPRSFLSTPIKQRNLSKIFVNGQLWPYPIKKREEPTSSKSLKRAPKMR